VAGASTLFASATLPKASSAAGARDSRFIVIVLRGALDGLSAVAPVGDPNYADLHGDIALRLSGDHPALPLDSFFALNPGMPVFARLFHENQAAVIHATATNYRERSHFDGQDVLQSGMPAPGAVHAGWLNRSLETIPQGAPTVRRGGLAIGVTTPLILRGNASVLGWAPQNLPDAGDNLAMRVTDLYQNTDHELAQAFLQGQDISKLAANQMGAEMMQAARGRPDSVTAMRLSAQGAARLMAAEDGPRIGALTFDGWDTHVNEGGGTGRLMQLLSGLDGAFEEFERGLGGSWKDTAIVAITEFGRTARINGTVGTDHGTGTVAFLCGGAIKGGRVIADWPGLKPAQLFENRDLMPTTDVRAVLKGLLADQFELSSTVLGTRVFPETLGINPFQGLITT
jgi:uncharacterized protein (DUF1501 family)